MRRPVTISLETRSLIARLWLPGGMTLMFRGAAVRGDNVVDQLGTVGGWWLPIDHRRLADGTIRLGDGALHHRPTTVDGTVELVDRRERHRYNDSGRILAVEDLVTGRPRWTLGREDGLLVTLTDERGRTWRLDHDADGGAAFVSPTGATTELEVDESGRLAAMTLPDGRCWEVEHASDGLLTLLRDPDGRAHVASHDADGALVRLEEPGLTTTLVVTDASPGTRTTLLRSDGSESSVTVEVLDTGRVRRTRRCCGVPEITVTESGAGGPTVTTQPDGTVVRRELVGSTVVDPVWGVATGGDVVQRTVRTPGGRERTIRRWQEHDGDVLVELLEVDGARHERRWDPGSRTLTATSPAGRATTVVHDTDGRVTHATRPDGTTIEHRYDADGGLVSTSNGRHRVGFELLADGGTRMDDGIRSTTVRHELMSSNQMLADGRVLRVAGEVDGTAVLTLDGDELGRFERVDADGPGSTVRCILPAVDGVTAGVTLHHDTRGRLSSVADGAGDVRYERDVSGPLTRIVTGAGPVRVERDTSGRPTALHAPWGETLRLERDGPVLTAVTSEGAAPVTVGIRRDGFRHAGYTVGGIAIEWHRDADGLVERAGPVTIDRDPGSGRVTSVRCGVVTTRALSDEQGRPSGRAVVVDGTEVARLEDRLDDAGRRLARRETIEGTSVGLTHTHDAAGRLVGVIGDDGRSWAATHDRRGNRIVTTRAGTAGEAAVVDARDRLVGLAEERFAYDAADRMVTRTTAAGTTTYRYGPHGDLAGATTADGTSVEHVLDPLGRRVATLVDGETTQRLVWRGARVVATLDGTGAVDTVFVDAGGRVPLAMLQGGRTLVLVADHLGSIRLVLDAATGEVVRRVDHDPDGRVTTDTAPGLHPFGFAGGLHDPTTGLVRFGAREYDPGLARFTRRDPILFAGGSTNLHGYADGDPLNRTDPTGHSSIPMPIDGDGGGSNVTAGNAKVYVCATDFLGVGEHGMIGIRNPDGSGQLYGMQSGSEGGLQTQWGDQTSSHGGDESRKCEEVPDVDAECVVGQIMNPDGGFKQSGAYGVDIFGQSETSPGTGTNTCWNSVFDAVRNCGGDAGAHLPSESVWDDVMNQTYRAMDAHRQMSSTPARVWDEVASWLD